MFHRVLGALADILLPSQMFLPEGQRGGGIGFDPDLQVRAADLTKAVHPAYSNALADNGVRPHLGKSQIGKTYKKGRIWEKV